jgi:hypothetical protein
MTQPRETDVCPVRKDYPFVNHTHRLEKSEYDREVWRCTKCGQVKITPNPITERQRQRGQR